MSKLNVVDCTGRKIQLTQPANRIVCLTAAGLDILLELEMEPVGYLKKGVAHRPEFYGDSEALLQSRSRQRFCTSRLLDRTEFESNQEPQT